MASKKKSSIYSDCSGSADELDEYGVWVKSGPQILSVSADEASLDFDDVDFPSDDFLETDNLPAFDDAVLDVKEEGMSEFDNIEFPDDDTDIENKESSDNTNPDMGEYSFKEDTPQDTFAPGINIEDAEFDDIVIPSETGKNETIDDLAASDESLNENLIDDNFEINTDDETQTNFEDDINISIDLDDITGSNFINSGSANSNFSDIADDLDKETDDLEIKLDDLETDTADDLDSVEINLDEEDAHIDSAAPADDLELVEINLDEEDTHIDSAVSADDLELVEVNIDEDTHTDSTAPADDLEPVSAKPDEDIQIDPVKDDFDSVSIDMDGDLQDADDLSAGFGETPHIEIGDDDIDIDMDLDDDLHIESDDFHVDLDESPAAAADSQVDFASKPITNETGFTDIGDADIPTVKSIENNINSFQQNFDSAKSGAGDLSSLLLQKIASELSSIRNELTDLKKEFAIARAGGDISRDTSLDVPHKEAEIPDFGETKEDEQAHSALAVHSGFFSEEDDETISLTGDELNNILATGESVEEQGIPETIDDDESISAQPLNIDSSPDIPDAFDDEDETIALTGDELNNIMSSADFTEEPGISPADYESPDEDLTALDEIPDESAMGVIDTSPDIDMPSDDIGVDSISFDDDIVIDEEIFTDDQFDQDAGQEISESIEETIEETSAEESTDMDIDLSDSIELIEQDDDIDTHEDIVIDLDADSLDIDLDIETTDSLNETFAIDETDDAAGILSKTTGSFDETPDVADEMDDTVNPPDDELDIVINEVLDIGLDEEDDFLTADTDDAADIPDDTDDSPAADTVIETDDISDDAADISDETFDITDDSLTIDISDDADDSLAADTVIETDIPDETFDITDETDDTADSAGEESDFEIDELLDIDFDETDNVPADDAPEVDILDEADNALAADTIDETAGILDDTAVDAPEADAIDDAAGILDDTAVDAPDETSGITGEINATADSADDESDIEIDEVLNLEFDEAGDSPDEEPGALDETNDITDEFDALNSALEAADDLENDVKDDELELLREEGFLLTTELPDNASYLEDSDDFDFSDAVIDEPVLSVDDINDDLTEPDIDESEYNLDALGDLTIEEPKPEEDEIPLDDEDIAAENAELNDFQDGIESQFPGQEISDEQSIFETEDLKKTSHNAAEFPAQEIPAVIDSAPKTSQQEASPQQAASAAQAPQVTAAVSGQGGKSLQIPSDLKVELRNILSYMDQLLESLPEEKIEEFAKSSYFDSYKKLFKDLGLV